MNPITDVTVNKEEYSVNIIENNSTVNVTESGGTLTIIDASPQVTVGIEDKRVVTVYTSAGGPYDQSNVLAMIDGQLAAANLDPALEYDLDMLNDLWTRVGVQTQLLIQQDGLDIEQTAFLYTDQEIALQALDIQTVDGRVDTVFTELSVESGRIDQNIVDISANGDSIVLHNSRITQTESDITSTVLRIDNIDGPGGDLELQQSQITQNAGDISLNVNEISVLDGRTTTAEAGIQLNTDDISLYVTNINDHENRLDSAEIQITANSAAITVSSEDLTGVKADLQATMYMTAKQWGVTVTESIGNYQYATGIGLVLHEYWYASTLYVLDSYVYFVDNGIDKIYRCILQHISDSSSSPTGVNGALYWVEDLGGEKTEFRIQADALKFYTSDSSPSAPLFAITGDALTLAPDISIRSSNYGHATEPWYDFNASTGLAQFQDIDFIFTTGGKTNAQTALNVSDGADQTALNTALDTANVNGLASTTIISAGKIGTGLVIADSILAGNITATHVGTNEIIANSANIKNATIVDAHIISLTATKVSATTLSEIATDTGIIVAGKLQNAAGTNFMDLDASGTSSFIKVGSNVDIKADGSGTFSRSLVTAPLVAASGTVGVASSAGIDLQHTGADANFNTWAAGYKSVIIRTGIITSGWSSAENKTYIATVAPVYTWCAAGCSAHRHNHYFFDTEIYHTGQIYAGSPGGVYVTVFTANGTAATYQAITNQGEIYLKVTLLDQEYTGGYYRIMQLNWAVMEV